VLCWKKLKGAETGVGTEPEEQRFPRAGHGRNGAERFVSSRKIAIAHPQLKHGDRCPECGKGNVYGQKEPKVLVRMVGQAPHGGHRLLARTVALRGVRTSVYRTRTGRSKPWKKNTTRPRPR